MENKSRTSLTKNCYIYVRVSTGKQLGEDHFSIENQIEKCKNYANLYNYTIIDIFKDEGFSGRNNREKRIGLTNCLHAMQNNDTLIIYSISRLSRNLLDFTSIVNQLKNDNKYIISVSENFDNSSASGSLIMNLLATFSQFESDQTSKRVSDTMQSLKNCDRIFGNIFYGFKMDPNRKGYYIINEEEDNIIKTIFQLKQDNNSIKQIVNILREKEMFQRNNKPFSYQSVYNILRNYENNKLKVEKNNQFFT